MIERAPDRISPFIREFCRTVRADQTPVFVPVEPVATAEVKSCFYTVSGQCEANGGTIAYGWAIWVWPRVWLIAEHHAVWQRPDGVLVDITPKTSHTARIVFLPDPDRVYDFATNRRIDNIRKVLNPDPQIQRYLEAKHRVYEYEEESTVEGTLNMRVNADKYNALKMSEGYLLRKLVGEYLGRSEPCPCGSGRRFGECHRRVFNAE